MENPEKLATYGTQNNPEKLATYGTQDNPEKLSTYGTQDEEKQSKNTTHYVLDTTMRRQA